MSSSTHVGSADVVAVRKGLRRELLRLARMEDEIAAREAATVPYWAPSPASVLGHRLAASVLRDSADQIGNGHATAMS
jgi:hypothetical protein